MKTLKKYDAHIHVKIEQSTKDKLEQLIADKYNLSISEWVRLKIGNELHGDNIRQMVNNKLDYLYDMYAKYVALNERTHYKYNYRLNGIQDQISALEDLLNNKFNTWDECYQEDLKESEGK